MAKKKHVKINTLEDLGKIKINPQVSEDLDRIELDKIPPIPLKKPNSKEYTNYYVINNEYVPEKKALVMLQEKRAVKEYKKYKALKWKYRAYLNK
jgi:hypothetical protein